MVHDIRERLLDAFLFLSFVSGLAPPPQTTGKSLSLCVSRICEMCQVRRRCRVRGKTLFAATAISRSPSVSKTPGSDANDSLNFPNT